MTAVGLGIWVYTQTGLAAPLLLTSFFAELPGMLFSSVAGALVDRWERKKVLILADAGQAAGSLLLLVSFLSGGFQIWHLYAVSLLQGCFSILQGPAEQATTTLLVPESWRERANGIKETAFPFAGVLAPVLAGLLYGLVGIQGIIALDLLTFFLAAGVVVFLHIPQPPPSPEGRAGRGKLLAELQAALAFLLQRRVLLYFLLYSSVMNFLLNGPLDLAIPYLLAITGSEQVMGWVMGAMSLGALSGALLITAWGGTRPRIHTALVGSLVVGAMYLVFGLGRQPPLLAAALFVLFMPLPIGNAMLVSILQVKTPPDLQGRIFALHDQLAYLGSTLSFLFFGPLVDRVLAPASRQAGWGRIAWLVGSGPGAGMGLLLCIIGLVILALTAAVYAWPRFRHMERDLPDYAIQEGASGEEQPYA